MKFMLVKKQEKEVIINGKVFKKTKFINKLDEDEINLDKKRQTLLDKLVMIIYY